MTSQKMDIVHINTHDIAGGAAKVAWRLAEAQRLSGHDSRLLVGFKRSESEYSLAFDPAPDLAKKEEYRQTGQLFYDLQGSHALASHQLVQSADILHLHNLHGSYFNPNSLIALSLARPVIWTLHDMQAITGHCAHSFECERWLSGCGNCPHLDIEPALAVDSSAQLWSDKKNIYDHSLLHIVTPSQWLKSKVERSILKDHSVEVIHNGIDTDTFQPFKKEEVRARFNIPQNAFVIGSAAHSGVTTNQWKGGHEMQEALEALWLQLPKMVFLNIGGNFKSSNPNFINTGPIDDENVIAQLYASLDVFMYTPVADNCPLVILEALACGVPIVSFEVGGVPELVQHGQEGFIIGGRNIRSMVNAVLHLHKERACLSGFAGAARNRAVSCFNGNSIADRYERAYLSTTEEYQRNSTLRNRSNLPKATNNKNEYPLISIVTPSFNQAAYLEECITSILSQNYPNLEYIIMDGGSTDGSVEIIRKYEKHLSYWQSRPDGGQYHAINEGFRRSTGEIMGWLNSDDKFHPNGLRVIADVFTRRTDVDFLTGTMVGFDKNGEPARWGARGQTWSRNMLLDKQNVRNYLFVMQEATYWRRSLWEKAGSTLDLSLSLAGDFELWARFSRFTRLCSVDALIAGFRWYSDEQRSQSQITDYLRECELAIDAESGQLSSDPGIDSVCPELIPYPPVRSSVSISVKAPLPRISIVTPSYNQAEYLEECIDSILSQNYPNLEFIIMDGGSTDGSVEIIRKHEKHLAYWQSKPDGGQYHAINEGFRRSTGEIMAWLNSDDKYHPGALHLAELAFRAMPQAQWITGRPTAWDDAGNLSLVFDHVPSWSPQRLLRHGPDDHYIQQESTFWRRTLWDRSGGGLETSWQLAADFELWCRFFRHAELVGVDALLGGFRYHGAQKTANSMDRYEQEVSSIIAKESRLLVPHAVPYEPPRTVAMDEIIAATDPTLTPEAFCYFTYSRRPHFNWFETSAVELFGAGIDPDHCDLKMYQDLLCYTFITNNVPMGSRILDIGGGDSRVLKALKHRYECWNLDKLEGRGNGLTELVPDGYRLVRAYIGDFSDQLPQGYFDFVFSISALEHVEESAENFDNICRDMDRVMKPGAHALHCFDVVSKPESTWTNQLLPYMYRRYPTMGRFTPFEQMCSDPFMYCLSEDTYNRGWREITGQCYRDFGRPLSCNILWQKPVLQPGSGNTCAKTGSTTCHDIVVATSIAPKNIENQNEAIASWLRLGFSVISVNTAPEIDLLKAHFPGVDFVETKRDARTIVGRPLVFLDDVMAALAASGSSICGIINSDIHLIADAGFSNGIADAARNSCVFGHRVDVESLAELNGELFQHGFDFFFFDKKLCKLFPPHDLCLGATWWDIWFPLLLILKNVPIKRLLKPVAYHVLHENRWDGNEWQANCLRVIREIKKLDIDMSSHTGLLSEISENIQKKDYLGFFKTVQSYILNTSSTVYCDAINHEPSESAKAENETDDYEMLFDNNPSDRNMFLKLLSLFNSQGRYDDAFEAFKKHQSSTART